MVNKILTTDLMMQVKMTQNTSRKKWHPIKKFRTTARGKRSKSIPRNEKRQHSWKTHLLTAK